MKTRFSMSGGIRKNQKIVAQKSQPVINNDNKIRYNELKQLFLMHHYTEVPTSFDYQYLVDQINHYTKEGDIMLAHIQGIHIKSTENGILPVILTERPVNGPLSSFFESVSSKQPQNDTFNLDQIKTVSAKQKFRSFAGRLLEFTRFIRTVLSIQI